MFLRLNSKALFPPHLLIRHESADFLEHDSYVELQQLVKDMEFDVQQSELLGRLTSTHIQALKIAIMHCDALTDEVKEFVISKLDLY